MESFNSLVQSRFHSKRDCSRRNVFQRFLPRAWATSYPHRSGEKGTSWGLFQKAVQDFTCRVWELFGPIPVEYLDFLQPRRLQWEKAMAPHSRTLAWKIPWTEEPGRLPSMGSRRVRHDWVTSLSLFIFLYWRRKWQPTPVFLPGESQGRGSLLGCRLWGHTELDTTEVT